jgi:hypothetical protein
MPKSGSALETAIAKITRKQFQPALKELRTAIRRMQRTLDKKMRVQGFKGQGRPGRPPGKTVGPPMLPHEVKALRARLGMTQAEFARATGVTHVAVYFWESGRTKPGGARLTRLRQLEATAAGGGKGGARKKSTRGGARKKASKRSAKA